MSTNTRHTTESQTAESQTTAPAQSTPTDAASADATTETTPDDAESWVARCRRQFDADRTDRLRNLVDGENEAMLE